MPNAVKDFVIASKSSSSIAFTLTGWTFPVGGGTLTQGTGGSVKGQCKRFKVNSNPQTEDISSVDTSYTNNMIIAENGSVEIEEMQRNGINANVVNALFASYDIISATFAYGRTTYGPFWGSRGQFSDEISAKGNNTMSGTLNLVDVGQTGMLPVTFAST